ncbi:hypothetical protein A2U01_0063172, partial [Trifolium medium]|nr:hypothetical protein [Trifolium medium]
QKFSKGKFSESSRNEPLEAQISDYDIPLNTVLPEPQTVHVSSSSSPDTAEPDEETDKLKEGVIKFGETPNPDAVAQHLFEDKQVSNLKFLEKHLTPNPISEHTFTHEQPQQTQPGP